MAPHASDLATDISITEDARSKVSMGKNGSYVSLTPNAALSSPNSIQSRFQENSDDMTDSIQALVPRIPKFDDYAAHRLWAKQHTAAAFRFLSQQGFDEGLAGHISVRDPEHHDRFWINPLCKAFSCMKASDLVLVDDKGKILKGGNVAPINPAGFMIHSAIHRARPDVNAAVHAHSVHGKAFSALGIELDMISQDACNFFYKDHSLYGNFGGTVLNEEEARHIADALADNSAVILQNHGLLTVGHTVDEAAYLFGSMDRLCHGKAERHEYLDLDMFANPDGSAIVGRCRG